ncbi:MAG: alpha/beta fold hydrolase [Microscillaceae bacterium]|nr:alpha/beta fold hydrolase [Microscillaceae bacterium]MDW8460399.1 alpha/beta fold hydrolase [Cytophagales bacterium]
MQNTLFFRTFGTGTPLIILHGLFGSSDNWLTIAKQLAANYTLYLLDQRNHGQSFWANEWDYEHMSQDLYHFVKEQNLHNFFLLGHSMGGKTAMQFATQFADKVRKLIVVDIAPRYYPVHHNTIIQGLQSLDLSQITTRQEADAQLASFIPASDVRQFLLKNLYRNAQNQFVWRINLEVIAQKIDNIGKALAPEAQFNKPTLFIRGEKSDYIRAQDEAQIYQHFPQAQIKTIFNAGHWVHADQPQTFIEMLTSFLEKDN